MFVDCVWFPLLTLILSYSVYCLPDRWCAAVPCRRIRESPISHHFHCLNFRLHFLWLLVLGTACDKTVADICRLESSYTANCRSSAPRRIGEVYMGWDLRRSSVLGTLETFCDSLAEVEERQQWSVALLQRQASFTDLYSIFYLPCQPHSPRHCLPSSICLRPRMGNTLHQ